VTALVHALACVRALLVSRLEVERPWSTGADYRAALMRVVEAIDALKRFH